MNATSALLTKDELPTPEYAVFTGADEASLDEQYRALAQGLALRPPPAEPTTCCGRGCNGCVWEGFADAAEYWRQEALLVLGYE